MISILISLISCNTSQKNKEYSKSENLNVEKTFQNQDIEKNVQYNSKGYELMAQKCYICHFEKPDPLKRDEMISPPMLRIQEHYKPAYTNKTEFVNAIVTFVKEPSREKTLMPRAVKKFKLMPKLIYDDEELRLIAETIYDYDFGSTPKMKIQMMGNTLQLNNGKKWILKKESIEQVNAVFNKLANYKSSNIADYNQLGKDIFNDVKKVMLDDSYSGELFDQIHVFFFGIEDNIHRLMATTSENEAQQQLTEIKKQLKEFQNYFEY